MAYRTTPEAEEDLAQLFASGILEHGMARAEAYIWDLLELLALIGREPLLMRLRDEYNPPVRIRQYKGHVVVYRDDDGDAVIVRILHRRQYLSGELN